jgi:hypothetical protein
VGRSEIEDALQRLDKLTHEEGRMAAAQGLRTATQGLSATHAVDERVLSLGNDVHDLGDGVGIAINKVEAVLDGAHLFFCFVDALSNLWLGGENMKEELQKVARDVGDLVKDSNDDKRS